MARCPDCGEPVSQFAAGCAICGADLEAARRRQAEKRARRPNLPSLPAVPEDLLTLAFLSLVTLALPLLGLILTVLAIRNHRLTTQGPLRHALYVVAGVGVVLLLSPQTRYSVFGML